MTEHTRPTICTYTGVEFSPLTPDPTDIRIADIAQALSNQCRFSGHTRTFYSVAQHSVLVCDLLPDRYKLIGLLHDAAEAYLVDVPSPMKRAMLEYQEHERHLQRTIYTWARIPRDLVEEAYDEVKRADRAMLAREQLDLMPDVDWWEKTPCSDIPPVTPLSPTEARRLFLQRWRDLRGH